MVERQGDEINFDGEPIRPAATAKRDWWTIPIICHLIRLCPGLGVLRLKGFDAWLILEVSLLQ